MSTPGVETRARKSGGISNEAIHLMVCHAMDRRQISGECIVDVGCGIGTLYGHVCSRFPHYVGVDAVRYDEFPQEAEFCKLDLETGTIPLPAGSADVVAAIEVIEHLENPRDFLRQLVRLAKPGGWIIVTTPNQLSLLSKLTLVVKNRFQAFQDVHYPAHLTALLEVDLQRIAAECALEEIDVAYSLESRIPSTAINYPRLLSKRFPRALSDNVLIIGKRPARY